MQARPMNFNVTEYEEFIDMVSDFLLQPTFKKLLAVGFQLRWHKK